MDNYTDQTLLEQYLRNELDHSQRKQLEERLTKEPELQQQLMELKELATGIRYSHLLELQRKMNDWEQRNNSSANGEPFRVIDSGKTKGTSSASLLVKNRTRIRYWAGIAAGVLLIAGIVWIWRSASLETAISHKDLFAAHFDIYPVTNTRSDSDQLSNQVIKGRIYYQAGKFEQAIPLLADSQEFIDRFYLAISFLGNQQPNKAIGVFDQLESELEKTSLLMDHIFWYKGLAFLLKNERDKAWINFTKIKSQKYQNVLKEIREEWPVKI